MQSCIIRKPWQLQIRQDGDLALHCFQGFNTFVNIVFFLLPTCPVTKDSARYYFYVTQEPNGS